VQLVVEASLYAKCPGPNGWKTPMGIVGFPRLPLAKLLAQKVTVVQGSDATWRGRFGNPISRSDIGVTGSTHERWTVRFERIP